MYNLSDDSVHLAEVENIYFLDSLRPVGWRSLARERRGEVCCVVSALQEQAKRSVEAMLEYGRLKLVWFKQSSQVVYVNE